MYQLSVTSTLYFKNESSTPSVTNFLRWVKLHLFCSFRNFFRKSILIFQWTLPGKTPKLCGAHSLKFQTTFGTKNTSVNSMLSSRSNRYKIGALLPVKVTRYAKCPKSILKGRTCLKIILSKSC